MLRLRSILLGAAFTVALAPTAAHADSIAYIKNGDVWLAAGDGTHQFQVTSTGGFSDVSQADDGTMIALHGVRLARLDRYGTVLADFDTPVSDTRPAGQRTFFGPYEPALSPDGTKVAYTYYYETTSQNASCFPPECVTAINEGGTGYSHADRATAWDEAGFYRHSGWTHPVWADDTTTILSDPTHLPNDDVVVDHPAARAGASGFMVNGWFSDTTANNPHLGAGDITRAGDKLAYATGDNDATLDLLRIRTFPTTFRDGEADASTRPEVCYRYRGATGGRFGTPTFSPDGAHAAEAEADGIHVIDVPSFANGCTTVGASPSTRLLIAGATQPDWGPADVPSGRPAAPGSGGAGGSGGATGSGGSGAGGTGAGGPGAGGSGTAGGSGGSGAATGSGSGGAGATSGGSTGTTPVAQRTCRIPRVTGLTLTRARGKLVAAGCRVRTKRHGRTVAAATTVVLTLGR